MPDPNPFPLEVGQSKDVPIEANQIWNRTGVLLNRGNTYSFSVDPSQKWYDAKNESNADGYPSIGGMCYFEFTRRVPKENWFKLIGSIGTSLAPPIVIGLSVLEFQAPSDGELRCFANDAYLMYWNNTGSVLLTVRRMK